MYRIWAFYLLYRHRPIAYEHTVCRLPLVKRIISLKVDARDHVCVDVNGDSRCGLGKKEQKFTTRSKRSRWKKRERKFQIKCVISESCFLIDNKTLCGSCRVFYDEKSFELF